MDQRSLPKRKRDHPGDDDESPQKVPKFEEGGKAVTDAAAAAVGVHCALRWSWGSRTVAPVT